MQIHESNFKTESPFVMSFEHQQDFTPTYVAPTVMRDFTPIPKKKFFRQILDLPKDIQELRTIQRSLKEDLQETSQEIERFDERLRESERKFSSFTNRIDDISFSVDPLAGQIANLKKETQQIQALSKSLQLTKIVIGALLLSNLVLIGLMLKPLIVR